MFKNIGTHLYYTLLVRLKIRFFNKVTVVSATLPVYKFISYVAFVTPELVKTGVPGC